MTPYDDSIPEENKQPYQELITFLRQATPRATSVTAEEQSQMLTRVRVRLQQIDHEATSRDIPFPQTEDPVSVPQVYPNRGKASRHSGRIGHALSMIAAVLVVGVIVGAAFLLFTTRTEIIGSSLPIGAPAGPINTPVTANVRTGNVEASLRITSGPYFLSELLGADMTFINHSTQSVFLQGNANGNSCDDVFYFTTMGGGEPHYSLPLEAIAMSCPFTYTRLDAGKTLTVHGYVPLLMSGKVTVTVEARFLSVKKNASGTEVITTGGSPLDGHLPAIHIDVAAEIPTDRTLSLQRQGSYITVHAPASIQAQLVYLYSVSCSGENGTNGMWTPVKASTLQEPGCSGLNKRWAYAVSAPGYAITSGELSS
jgi:hypothetical protein